MKLKRSQQDQSNAASEPPFLSIVTVIMRLWLQHSPQKGIHKKMPMMRNSQNKRLLVPVN
jgi:hypothetical protein